MLSKFTLAGWTVGLSTNQNDTICLGTVVKLYPYTNTGCGFSWNIPPTVSYNIVGSDFEFSFSTPGQYTISITLDGTCGWYWSAYQIITVLPLPAVGLTSSFDSICSSVESFSLTSGTPKLGTYSGLGVSGNTFSPSFFSTADSIYIYYEYSDFFGCSSIDSSKIYVTENCETSPTNTTTVYPNPTSGEITFKGMESEVSIADLSGKEVMHFNLSDQISVYLNASPGVYFYNVRDKNGGTTKGKILLTK